VKLNELNLKLNNNDENFKHFDEKMLFMKNTHYYFFVGFFTASKDLILNLNQDPLEFKCENTVFAQIFALKKLEKDELLKLIDENSLDNDGNEENRIKIENDNFRFFYYDKPFFKNIDNNNSQSIENLWIERNVLFVDFVNFIEYFNEFVEIKRMFTFYLEPIQNARKDCDEKTCELREFINNFTHNVISLNNSEIMSQLQQLNMRLLGCLDGN
jgi:hypothetical protein